MLVISVVSIVALALWEYIFRGQRKIRKFLMGITISVISGAELVAYGYLFPVLQESAWLALFHRGALAAVTWLLMLCIAVPILLVGAAGCFVFRCFATKKQTEPPESQPETGRMVSRRTFVKGLAAALPAAAIATSAAGNIAGESYLATTMHELYYPDLPDYLDGYRIGQLSDTHMGLFFGPEELQQSIDAAAAAKVNRLELTGDLVDELTLLPKYEEILNKNARRFPDGIDFCYGNHEYYRDMERITAMLKKTPVRILRNSNFCASSGRGAGLAGRKGTDTRSFYIAGADYSFAKGQEAFQAERDEFVQRSLQNIPEDAFVVLLAHHSAFIDEGFAHHIPLTLCGHTHGAQFAPIGPIVQAVGFTYLRGMYSRNGCHGYVNRGTGHWLPLRVFCSREVSVFELHKKS